MPEKETFLLNLFAKWTLNLIEEITLELELVDENSILFHQYQNIYVGIHYELLYEYLQNTLSSPA